MRLLLFFISFFLFTSFSVKDVPEAVKTAFKNKFPEVKKVHWEKRGENYEAEYKLKKQEIEVVFKADGNWMYTVIELDRRQLPVEVVNGFRSEGFSDWKLDEAGIADTPLYTQVYLIEAQKDNLEYDLFFDKKGKLLQKLMVKRGK